MPQHATAAPHLPACLGPTCSALNGHTTTTTHHTGWGLRCACSRGELLACTDINDGIHLSVWLHGHAVLHVERRRLRIAPHDTVAFTCADALPHADITPCAHHVDLLLPRQQLLELGGEQGEPFLDRLERQRAPRITAADADTLRAANELVAILQTSNSCSLLRDAKTLELLARLLAAGLAADPASLTAVQRERLHHARQLLLADLANPPTIAQLARSCGLNSFKLKQGFRSMFGQSIHALYQAERMQKAWQLIESAQVDVSGAGHQVGYSNLSHFSAAFRKHFGLLPGQLKRCASLPR